MTIFATLEQIKWQNTFYHELVKTALENEGWSITHDPFYLSVGIGRRKVAADFGAEKFILANRGVEKILVEIKSFITSSNINELHHSVGQYDFYALLLEEQEPDRIPFLAMPKDAYEDLIREPIVHLSQPTRGQADYF
jgi:hypothetical protein